ncbi:MAG: hypothetical protein HOK56_05810 [Deltaproteobacteria bacterium]|nr:hypothetical protein [Deltaproteobacteria bacterium]
MKSTNYVYQLKLGMRAGLVFLLFGLFMLTCVGSVSAIDYFKITNPKFIPVKVGLSKESSPEVVFLQNVFKTNLEKLLYFQFITESKEEFDLSEEVIFHLDLELKNKPFLLKIMLWSQGEKVPVSKELYPVGTNQDLRKLGLKLTDWFIKNTLGFEGVSTSRISYTVQKSNRRKNIFLSSFDGTVLKRFSYNLGSNNLSSWSFDGNNILYTTLTRSSAQLAIQPAKRLRAKILSFPSGFQPLSASWNLDGESILLTLMKQGNADIYNYHLGNAQLDKIFAWKSLETSPQMSPDGRKIAFVSDSARPRRPQIYIHNLNTLKTERVTFKGNFNSSPNWSPNGTQLIYERQEKGYFQLYIYTLSTRRHLQLTFGRFNSEKPDWAPNGKQIVFSAKKKNVPKLYYISSFGGRTIRVTKTPSNIAETNPVWSR